MGKKDANPPSSFILLQGDSVHGYRATHLTIPESNPFSRFGRLQHQVNSFSENEDLRCIKTSGISHEEASATSTSWWNMLTHPKRSLAGNSPWGCKESDSTERLTHIIRQDESKPQGHQRRKILASQMPNLPSSEAPMLVILSMASCYDDCRGNGWLISPLFLIYLLKLGFYHIQLKDRSKTSSYHTFSLFSTVFPKALISDIYMILMLRF